MPTPAAISYRGLDGDAVGVVQPEVLRHGGQVSEGTSLPGAATVGDHLDGHGRGACDEGCDG
jgi:hypothetical protein